MAAGLRGCAHVPFESLAGVVRVILMTTVQNVLNLESVS